MVEGYKKSRSKRHVKVRLPTGKVTVHYVARRPAKAQCSNCGTQLHGVPRIAQNELKNTSKSQKRPERPFGGNLCSRCTRRTIIAKYRNIFSLSKK